MANDVLEAGEILKDDNADKALKQDLDNLAKNINVKESSLDKVEALFAKLGDVENDAKNRALQYALQKAKIKVGKDAEGNDVEMSVAEIAEVFENAVQQADDGSWKIKLKDGASDGDKELVEGFLNEKESSLAYLIQLSSQKASLQASRGYGRNNADSVIDVADDKKFGNQTRRALSGLKEWVQGDYTKDVESIDVKKITKKEVLELNFISKELKEKIENEGDENVKGLWNDENYELRSKYINNFALKPKGVEDGHDDILEGEEENDSLEGLDRNDYTEETKNLIERYGKKLNIPEDLENKKRYIQYLNNIMNDSDKKGGLKSLLALQESFWGSYKIDLSGIKTLEQKLDSAELDGTEDTFEIVDDEDDYVTIKGGKLVKIAKNNESHHEPVFEANGTSSRDDYRFDSVEAFMKFIGGEKVITASEHVETLSAKAGGLKDLLKDGEFENYKDRFSDDLLNSNSAELDMTGDRYETFLSLLTLDDKFWGNYKLTVKDIQNFKRGMEKDLFDYSTGSSTVFHANGLKFEVDGTGNFSDDTFGSVGEFFNWLENKL